jgi:WNK lysine deficient protein kinase
LAFNCSFQTKPCQGRNMTSAHDWFEGRTSY